MNQLMLNAICISAIQHVKNSKWFPWLSAETERLNRFVAIIVSGATAFGIHTSFDHSNGVLTITGLTLATIGTGIYNWGSSYITQQVLYKATVATKTVEVKDATDTDTKPLQGHSD